MNNYERTAIIEQYLDGELQGNDIQKFELQIQTDKDIKDDLFIQRKIREVLKNKDEFDLRVKLNKIQDNYKNEKKKVHKKTSVLTYVFITLSVLIVISVFFLFNNKLSNDELYEKYYKHYSSEIITQSSEVSTDNNYIKALSIYDKGLYKVAISEFEKINESSPYYISKEYYTGLSYMELQNYSEAINHFNTVAKSNNSLIVENAIWYSALCYLKINKNQLAIEQFKKLLDKDSAFKKEAVEIINEIENDSD